MTEALYSRVQAALSSLQLTTMREPLDDVTRQAATHNWSALEYLDNLTQLELSTRFERDVQRKLRQARLPFFKTRTSSILPFNPPSTNARSVIWSACASSAIPKMSCSWGRPGWAKPIWPSAWAWPL